MKAELNISSWKSHLQTLIQTLTLEKSLLCKKQAFFYAYALKKEISSRLSWG